MSSPTRAVIGVALLALAVAPAAEARDGAAHSLRAPVTGENFYFVMADRFENGSSANDDGGLGDDPEVSGYDPTHKGYYHGGDLKGLLDRIDYKNVNKALAGNVSPEEALKKAQTDMDKALETF